MMTQTTVENQVSFDSPLLQQWEELIPFATTDESFEVRNPATGALLATLPCQGPSEAARAIESARKAFSASEIGLGQRVAWLGEIATLLQQESEELARIITLEQGKPLDESRAEVDYAAGFFTYYATQGEALLAPRLVEKAGPLEWEVFARPAGVVALITPWNFPLAMLAKKLSAALLAGCAVIIKPSELTPLTALAFLRLLRGVEGGEILLPGPQETILHGAWVNLVFGNASGIGHAFCKNEAIRVLSFTGSTSVGRLLSEQAASGIKRMALELGGNAPFLIFADADLQLAVDALVQNKFRCAGQTCVCTNRVYVAREIESHFLEKLLQRASALRVGDGFEEGVDFGPLINHAAYEKVAHHIADALEKGATCHLGGGIHPPPGGKHGFFFPATILTGITPEMCVSREETFGPVISIGTFETEEEALTLANGTPYGLAAYLFTGDEARVARCVEQLRFGHVGVNTAAGPAPEAPFGGMKQSGYGREGGAEGALEFCELQTRVRRP